MILSELTQNDLRARLASGLTLRIAPVAVRVHSSIASVAAGLAAHYGAHDVLDDEAFADFHIGLHRPPGLRHFFRPQVDFLFDAEKPFKPLPLNQAYPFFEWGLNWCMANSYHRFVVMHAAVVERKGFAVVLPAPPGSGKSTLCAALVCNGWRLFSDELALCAPGSTALVPMPRPICLKNESIDIIAGHFGARIGKRISDTRKGDIAYLPQPASATHGADRIAEPRWIIFPKYVTGSPLAVTPVSKPETVVQLAEQCFNYPVLGGEAFDTVCAMVDQSECLSLSYSRFDDVLAWFDRTADEIG